ncbi:MAG: transposase, partial [Prevotella salivae]|nr:transposase [Segatella salivae]
MPQYLNQILVHCVFHKHAKAVNIQAQDQLPLNQFVMQTCHFLHCPCLIANGVADHLHFLLVLATNTSVADVVKEVKRKATLFLKERNPSYY